MKRIDGASIAQKVHEETNSASPRLQSEDCAPGLAVILVGEDPASRAYVRSKDKKAAELGLHSVKYELPADTLGQALVERWCANLTRTRLFTVSSSNHRRLLTSTSRQLSKPSILRKGCGRLSSH